jgi:hypothetical protein
VGHRLANSIAGIHRWSCGLYAFLEGVYALTKRHVFLNLSQFWLRIFANRR